MFLPYQLRKTKPYTAAWKMIAFYFNLWTLAKSRSEQLTHPIWALDEPKVNIVWPHQRPQACYKLRRSYDTQAVKHAHSSQGQNRNFSRLPHFIFLSRDLRVSSTRNLSPLNFLFPKPFSPFWESLFDPTRIQSHRIQVGLSQAAKTRI